MSHTMWNLAYFVFAVLITAVFISTVKFVLRGALNFFLGEFK